MILAPNQPRGSPQGSPRQEQNSLHDGSSEGDYLNPGFDQISHHSVGSAFSKDDEPAQRNHATADPKLDDSSSEGSVNYDLQRCAMAEESKIFYMKSECTNVADLQPRYRGSASVRILVEAPADDDHLVSPAEEDDYEIVPQTRYQARVELIRKKLRSCI